MIYPKPQTIWNREGAELAVYTDDNILYRTFLDINEISALYMIADIQLCYYPENVLLEMLQDAGLIMKTVFTDDGWTRTVFDKDDEIIRIQRKGKHLEYKNTLRNYEYSIEEIY